MENNDSLAVPRIVRIGTVGPKKIADERSVRKNIVKVLRIIDEKLKNTPHAFLAVSPLSEGFDRLLTQEILNFAVSNKIQDNSLEIIFQNKPSSTESLSETEDFIKMAVSKRNLKSVLKEEAYTTREEFYTLAGQVVADDCDILIALSDRNRKDDGDTVKIIDYARKNVGRSIFFIDPQTGVVSEEENDDHTLRNLKYHDLYNFESVLSYAEIKKAQQKDYGYVYDKINSLNIPEEVLDRLNNNFFMQLVRADLLALHYQFRHMVSINMVYYFSVLAVAMVTFKVIFTPHFSIVLIAEAILMLTIVLILLRNKSHDWHRKWIDYRFLAERLRSGLIFSVVGMECEIYDPLPHLRSHNDWTSEVYQWIHQSQKDSGFPMIDFEVAKKFILVHWIDDQIDYYNIKSNENWVKHQRITNAIYILFIGAFVGAFTNAILTYGGYHLYILSKSLAFVAIVFPAIAATLAGIRIQHEYSRNSKRFTYMEIYLKKVRYEIGKTKTMEKLKLILEKTNKMTLREQQDWRALIAIHEPEPP
ncbi:MAG: hypothetical protein A4E25_01236 [Methanobacterium sp. PtaB.Bin024]|jgi:hypothetical protein|nr:MAG: hypothetical protein A4E25_01236 [Methanobacterium sp. PtaB.Bin024]